MYKKKLISSILGLVVSDLVLAMNALTPPAHLESQPNNYWQAGPWSSRFTSQGLISRSELAGFFDGMIPILGQDDRLVYVDGAFMGGRNQSSVASIGTGVRSIQKLSPAEVILGGFFFADYQKMNNQIKTWIANPGLELLTKQQELRVQGYFPIGQRSQTYRSIMASDISPAIIYDSGIANIARISGHSVIDAPVNLTHEYGVGVEGEVGQYFPLGYGAWLRGGAYHFDYRNAQSVNGLEANVELYTGKNLSLLVQDNYDNQNKNWVSVGIRLSFGGPDYTQVNHLRNRMEEPVIRHIARQPAGAATPIRDSYVLTGPIQTTNNIWFFSPNGTNFTSFNTNVCTAEHPCRTLSQPLADGITATTTTTPASLWFASGNYALSANNGVREIYLGTGQRLFGRSADFATAASTTARPMINGGLWWNGNGSFQDMNINNTGQINTVDNNVAALGASNNLLVNHASIIANAVGVGVRGVRATGDASVNNTTVLVNGNLSTRAVYASNNVTVDNSQLNALSAGTGNIYGAVSDNGGVVVRNSKINAASTGASNFVIAASAFSNKPIVVEDSEISAKGSNVVVGVNNATTNAVVNRTSINVEGSGGQPINGIFAQTSVDANAVHITINNTSIGQTLGIVTNAGDIRATDTTINASGAGDVFGIFANGNSVYSTRNTITAKGVNSGPQQVYGLFAFQTATINGSTISVKNTNNSTTGLTRGAYASGNINLVGDQSVLSASSSTPANAKAVESITGVVANNSTPKSKCSVNGGVTSDCA